MASEFRAERVCEQTSVGSDGSWHPLSMSKYKSCMTDYFFVDLSVRSGVLLEAVCVSKQ